MLEFNSVQEQYAWLAGFFEGEGSWSVYARRPEYPTLSFRATITQKGLNGVKLLEKVIEITGFGSISKRLNVSDPDEVMYSWATNRHGEVEKLFNMIGSYLGPRRIARYHELNNQYQESLISYPPRKPGPAAGFKRDETGKMIRDIHGEVIREY